MQGLLDTDTSGQKPSVDEDAGARDVKSNVASRKPLIPSDVLYLNLLTCYDL